MKKQKLSDLIQKYKGEYGVDLENKCSYLKGIATEDDLLISVHDLELQNITE